MLTREFYLRDTELVAQELLGKLLIHKTEEGTAAGMIVEVESYLGPEDKGAHSYGNRKSERTRIQYGPGGYAYVFAIYGMHWCLNAVTNGPGKPEVVLVRALEPVEGIELMKSRRGTQKQIDLCNGPGKLCQALGITKAQYGADLCGDELYILEHRSFSDEEIGVSPRINIDYAQEWKDRLWRYYVKGNAYVSKVPKRYHTDLTLNDTKHGKG